MRFIYALAGVVFSMSVIFIPFVLLFALYADIKGLRSDKLT